MRGRPRKDAVDAGVEQLATLISEAAPERILAVKAPIAGAVRAAAGSAGFDGPITELPFPVRQWRPIYVARLAIEMGGRSVP